MTRYRGARGGTVAATGLPLPGRWAELALCAQADPGAWVPAKGQRASAKTAARICGACRFAASAWTTHCPALTPGAESRPASGAAPAPRNATSCGSYERRWPRER